MILECLSKVSFTISFASNVPGLGSKVSQAFAEILKKEDIAVNQKVLPVFDAEKHGKTDVSEKIADVIKLIALWRGLQNLVNQICIVDGSLVETFIGVKKADLPIRELAEVDSLFPAGDPFDYTFFIIPKESEDSETFNDIAENTTFRYSSIETFFLRPIDASDENVKVIAEAAALMIASRIASNILEGKTKRSVFLTTDCS